MATELDIKTSGGNKKALEIHIKTSGGNKKWAEAWIKTSGGNKKFWPSSPPITDLQMLYLPYNKFTTATILGVAVRQSLTVGFDVVGGSGTYNVNFALSAISGYQQDTFGGQAPIDFTQTADPNQSYISIGSYTVIDHSDSVFGVTATQFTRILYCDTNEPVFTWESSGDPTQNRCDATLTVTVEDAVSGQTISEAVPVAFIWQGNFQYCIDADSYMPFDFKAEETYNGMPLYILDEESMNNYKEHYVVNHSFKEDQDSVEIETSSGIQLVVSKATPITIQSGKVINVMDSLGEYVPVLDNDDFRWEEITKLTDVGLRRVVRIFADNKTYAAGKHPNRFIFTHNKIEP